MRSDLTTSTLSTAVGDSRLGVLMAWGRLVKRKQNRTINQRMTGIPVQTRVAVSPAAGCSCSAPQGLMVALCHGESRTAADGDYG
ncbi:hypothetical protein D9M71_671500 [compost metagenome]